LKPRKVRRKMTRPAKASIFSRPRMKLTPSHMMRIMAQVERMVVKWRVRQDLGV